MSVSAEVSRIRTARNTLRDKMLAAGFSVSENDTLDTLVEKVEFQKMTATELFSTTATYGVTSADLSDDVSNYEFILLVGVRYSTQADRQTLLIPKAQLSASARWNMGYSSYIGNYTVWGTRVATADTRTYFNIVAVYGLK